MVVAVRPSRVCATAKEEHEEGDADARLSRLEASRKRRKVLPSMGVTVTKKEVILQFDQLADVELCSTQQEPPRLLIGSNGKPQVITAGRRHARRGRQPVVW